MVLLATAFSPAPIHTTPVVVANRSLPAGTQLAASDLSIVQFPDALAPTAALGALGEAANKQLSVAVSPGTPLTDNSLLSTNSLAGKGEQLAPFRVSDAAIAALLHVGDIVTVVASTTDNQVVTIARKVRIAALPGAATDSGITSSGSSGGPVVVVSCDEKTAGALAAWAGSSQLGITLG